MIAIIYPYTYFTITKLIHQVLYRLKKKKKFHYHIIAFEHTSTDGSIRKFRHMHDLITVVTVAFGANLSSQYLVSISKSSGKIWDMTEDCDRKISTPTKNWMFVNVSHIFEAQHSAPIQLVSSILHFTVIKAPYHDCL